MSRFLRRVYCVWLMLLVVPTTGAVLPAADSEGRPLPSLAPLLKNVNPSVVNISTYTTRTLQQNPLLNDPFFRRFFNIPQGQTIPQTRRSQSAGSGVIINAERGTVVTNHHVVNGADEITVGLEDGRSYQASLIGSDPEVDIAVLQLQKFENLTELPIADSDQLQVGDFVVAIGNPFGLGQTVTSGVVSALGRSGLGMQGYENFIQTDASINPGNSGGALVNLSGELVGINTAIIAPAGGNIGIGFAIPTNMAKASIDQIVRFGAVERGQLGIIIQDLTRELATAFDIDQQQRGVVIAQVQQGSAADKAGLLAGDIVISIDAKPIKSTAELRFEIGRHRVGDKIQLTVLRDGKSQLIKAKIGEAGDTEAAKVRQAKNESLHPFLEGASLQATEQSGIKVIDIEPASKAAFAGLRPGDIILSANREQVSTMTDLAQAVQNSDRRLVLLIQRGNVALYIVLQ
ncbi:DegQ family serine endoprotease [uncultured Oceanicoccus sp.]|uniref:DegQ family serine endoprotease n=1 Tax=uncultured Oceanicoccus sp. TaxID=1706381 RepID=UPI0030DDC46E